MKGRLFLLFVFVWLNTFGQQEATIAKEFAKTYSPNNKPNQGPALLKSVPDSVVHAFEVLRATNEKDCEKYLTLIFLRLYRAHLECCNQSYEV
jgi:hypothetical protein